ncbi:MAG: type II toxin-antitoxin system PemK/MazF family toxin [Prochlorococcaceae cyanobacterium]
MFLSYVPNRGDLAWLEFTPQTGSQQAGRRPALMISPKAYNARVGLALLCPVTSRVKGYPFEVALAEGSGVIGVVLADQLNSLDWRARKAKLIDAALCALTAHHAAGGGACQILGEPESGLIIVPSCSTAMASIHGNRPDCSP